MKKRKLHTNLLLLFVLFFTMGNNPVKAQANSALEFAKILGDGNPTGNGPVNATTINFVKNTNNPTGNTFVTYTPGLSATFTLSDPEYTNSNYTYSQTGGPVAIGGAIGGGTAAIFDAPAGNPNASSFTSSGATAGNGISTTSNKFVTIRVSNTFARMNSLSTTGRHRAQRLTVEFNRPVNNPILHLSSLGAALLTSSSNPTVLFGFSAELDVFVNSATTAATLNRISGNTALVVSGNQINNGASNIGDGNYGDGSVQVIGTGITSLVFEIYLRGDRSLSPEYWTSPGTNGVYPTTTGTYYGETFSLGISLDGTEPIGCDNTMYFSAGGNTQLNAIVPAAGQLGLNPVGAAAGFPYNAMAIDPLTGIMYAMRGNTNMYQINGDGTTVNLGAVSGLSITPPQYVSGEIDPSGNYYVAQVGTVGTIYKINTTTKVATAITLPRNITISDMAYNVNDDLLYAIESDGQLISINPVSGVVTNIGTPYGSEVFGAMWGSNTGSIYAQESSGNLYQYDPATGKRVLIATGTSATGTDGAHCVTSPITFEADLSVTKTDERTTYVPGTINIYRILVKNNGPFGVMNAHVSDLVPVGIPTANVSYRVSYVSSGSLTNVSGTQTGAIDDYISLPADGFIEYVVTVTIPESFTGNLTNTVTVTPPADSVDPNMSNNTATDTDTQNTFPCVTSNAFSTTGWQGIVYDAPDGMNAWGEISSSTGFPTASYSQVATFDYNQNANTNHAFTLNFETLAYGLTTANPQLQNYTGTPIFNNPWETDPTKINEDYAIFFTKTIQTGEEGKYQFDLTYGDDHIFIYKNGVKVKQQQNAYTATPLYNFVTLDVVAGDVISVLLVEEWEFNTAVTLVGSKLNTPLVEDLTNDCPNDFVDLNDAHTGTVPLDTDLVWFTNDAHSGTALTGTQVTQAGAGIYYAFYYNSANDCYSPASEVEVTIEDCPLPADLYVTKTDGKTNYIPGFSTTYTIVAGNNGSNGVEDAIVEDLVPAGIPAINMSYTAVASAGSSTNVTGTQTGAINDLVSLPVGGTVTYTVTVNIPSNFSGDLVNTVTITPPNSAVDINMLNNTATDTNEMCTAGNLNPILASSTISPAPATVADLIAALAATNQPAGTVFTIHSGASATDANKLPNSTAIVPGTTYYASFSDGLANCYSPTSKVYIAIPNSCLPDPYAAQQTWWFGWGRGEGGTALYGDVIRIDFQTGTAVLNNPPTGFLGQDDTTLGYEGHTNVTNPVTGEFLFGTDGNTIYRASDGTKATGGGIGGHFSAGQAAAVIPDPQGVLGKDFIVFGNTSDTSFDPAGLNMGKYNLENNTVVGVTNLLPANAITGIREALQVVPKSNGRDYWILVISASATVRVYEYTIAGGFNPTIISEISIPNTLNGSNIGTSLSWIPQQENKIVVGMGYTVGMVDFNRNTGVLANYETKVTTTNVISGYSPVISPNGKYLYYANDNKGLNYINLSDNSRTTIYSPGGSYGVYGIKVSPNGRLYFVNANYSTVWYINNANNPPTGIGSASQFLTGGKKSSLALPNNTYWSCEITVCQTGTDAPILASTTISSLPATVTDLISVLAVSNLPANTVLTIHSGSPATDSNQLASSTAIVAGSTYYVAFWDEFYGCYSPTTEISIPIVNNCITGDCNTNAFLNTGDPNTLEYDNFISGFHSSIIKQNNGSYLIWGQGAKPDAFGEHLYEPTEITPANGFNYTGDILKAALGTRGATNDGSDQYAILTTDGLYIWGGGDPYPGRKDVMVHRSVKDSETFDKMTSANIPNANTYGLPDTVTPDQVKMLFGSFGTLAITTCAGEVYVLSWTGAKNGDGTPDDAANQNIWHRVMKNASTPLNGVVATRGTVGALMALTHSGEIYTWGSNTYLGDGSDKEDRSYATKMTLPTGVTPKMIGMTKASNMQLTLPMLNGYYLLSTSGEVYSLGDNSKRQLGTFDNVEQKSWVNVKSTDAATNLTDIVWISPNEHDGNGHATVTALTSDGKLWGWGMNHVFMLGNGLEVGTDPRFMFGGLDPNDKILAIETGGHINTIFKDCDYKLGYIGHSSNGSYAKFDSPDGTRSSVFKFDGAKMSNLCSIDLPAYPEVIDLEVCEGLTADLADALQNTVPVDYTLQWWTTQNRVAGTQVADPANVPAGTYYTFFVSNDHDCPNLAGEEVIVAENPAPVVPQDVANIKTFVNNNFEFTMTISGYDSYTWEYATAAVPADTDWNTLDNTTYSGVIILDDTTFRISHATKAIDGLWIRLKAVSDKGCESYSNEVLIEVGAGGMITNPMLPSKARR